MIVYPGIEKPVIRPDHYDRKIASDTTNLFGYVEKFGSFPIDEKHPLNHVDGLILCRLSYMYFEGLLGSSFHRSAKIKDIGPKYLELVKIDSCTVLQIEDVKLMEMIMNAKRFANWKLTGYQSIYSEKNTEQFAAVTVLLPNKTAFISYRGTDGSLNGWREDFNLGFLGILPSDIDALKYLKDAIENLSDRYDNFMVGGHSKGGNLAAYAASCLPVQDKKKISKVLLIDAPGFRRDVFEKLKYKSLGKKVEAFSPCQSLFGVILYNIAPIRVVVSDKLLAFQHDIYQWRIRGEDFYFGNFQSVTWAVKKMSKDVFETMSHEEVERCLDMLFGILKESNKKASGPAMNMNWSRILGMLFLLRKLSKNERNLYFKIFGMVASQMRLIGLVDKKRQKGIHNVMDLMPKKS